MDAQKVDMFMITNQKYFPADKMMYIKEKLLSLDPSKEMLITSVNLKDPTMLLVVSILAGSLGIDRFMLGDIGMGILKLLTLGCCGILTIVDWFTVSNRTKEANFNNFMMLI